MDLLLRRRGKRRSTGFDELGSGPLLRVARVENSSRALRQLPPRRSRFQLAGRLAVREDAPAAVTMLPGAETGVSSAASEIVALRADAVMVLRSNLWMRLRAFYFDAGLSMVLNTDPKRLGRLGHSAATVRRVAPLTDLVLPRPIERHRRLAEAWLVEELVAGERVAMGQWPAVVEQLADGLQPVWVSEGLERRRTNSGVRAQIEKGRRLATEMAPSLREELARRGDSAPGENFVVGLCHGDPGPPNVLTLPAGRLGLVDWETVGRAPLVRDVVKMAAHLEEPLDFIESIHRSVRSRTDLDRADWMWQMVSECLRSVGRAEPVRERALHSGDDALLARISAGQQRHVRLVERLTARLA